MLALDLIDRRTMWRDYWIEWMVATVLIAIDGWLQWRVARLSGADVPFAMMLPQFLISICVFPLERLGSVAHRPLEAWAGEADPNHQRPPVDHLLAPDAAARRRPGRSRQPADRPAGLARDRPEREIPAAVARATASS